jgi:uncharacterized protein YjbI with pentapeptide repeats/formylglycine-generating enzyme required for sulfatase activity
MAEITRTQLMAFIHSGSKPRLQGLELSGLDLSNLDLSDLDLTRTNMSEVNLSGANLAGTTLRNADLSGANLSHCVLKKCDLQEAQLAGVNVYAADFSDANLTSANLCYLCQMNEESNHDIDEDTIFINAQMGKTHWKEARIYKARFNGANLEQANLNGDPRVSKVKVGINKYKIDDGKLAIDDQWDEPPSKTSYVYFEFCTFSSVNFTASDLTRAKFKYCDFNGAKFYNSNISNASFDDSSLIDVDLQESILVGCSFRDCSLRKSDFRNAIFSRIDMAKILAGYDYTENDLQSGYFRDLTKGFSDMWVHLKDANLSEANLQGTDLSRLKLEGVDFSNANLSSANLKEAILTGANFYQSNLNNANLEKAYIETTEDDKSVSFYEAKLRHANFSKAHMRDPGFRNADLSYAIFEGAFNQGADFEGAILTGTRFPEKGNNFESPYRGKQVSSSSLYKNGLNIALAENVYMDFVYVPCGEFWMGSELALNSSLKEKPLHKIYLDSYLISKFPITNKFFAYFVKETGYKTLAEEQGFGTVLDNFGMRKKTGLCWWNSYINNIELGKSFLNYPVVQVSWQDASEFCAWLSNKSNHEIRLPTEAEWEKAARGSDKRVFPWGNEEIDDTRCRFNINIAQIANSNPDIFRGDLPGTTPVGKFFPADLSPYGCSDMLGNVYEWVRDWVDDTYYRSSPYNNPKGPTSGENRGNRGGSWLTRKEHIRITSREGVTPSARSNEIGFRCVCIVQ